MFARGFIPLVHITNDKLMRFLNIKVIKMLDILAIILGLSEVSFVIWLVVKNLYIKGDR